MPMVHEAIDRFLGHLTVEVAKPVFDLLIYRRKHSLTEEVLEEHFEQVIIEEQTYQYYLARMRRELEQLFELTPPYLHKKLRSQVNGLPLALEKAIERKGIISQLKWSNSFSVKKVYRPDGQFELPAIAVSSCLQHGRAAHLRFSRGTHYQGEIGHHPQDPALKPPHPDHLA